MIRRAIAVLSLLLPWPLRRRLLVRALGFDIHPTARIGRSFILPRHLRMGPHSAIGDLTVCKGLDLLELGAHSLIGRLNWITGFPSDDPSFFSHRPDRRPQLIVGDHSAITNRHLLDCTESVVIGRFSTVAGFHSQMLTHSIDLRANRQDAHPIQIGDYCFVGTGCVILGGARLPDYSVLGALSLCNHAFSEPYSLYGGTPARHLKTLDRDLEYFRRQTGFVH